jgi:hypothetical protein
MVNTTQPASGSTAKEIKRAINAIVRGACFPDSTLKEDSEYQRAYEFISTLPPDTRRDVIALADAQIENHFATIED